jgi:hypothetical protein
MWTLWAVQTLDAYQTAAKRNQFMIDHWDECCALLGRGPNAEEFSFLIDYKDWRELCIVIHRLENNIPLLS